MQIAEVIEDTEAYFVIKINNNQHTTKTIANLRFKNNKIPKYTATPFPPLNFNQIVKMCPRNTNIDDK